MSKPKNLIFSRCRLLFTNTLQFISKNICWLFSFTETCRRRHSVRESRHRISLFLSLQEWNMQTHELNQELLTLKVCVCTNPFPEIKLMQSEKKVWERNQKHRSSLWKDTKTSSVDICVCTCKILLQVNRVNRTMHWVIFYLFFCLCVAFIADAGIGVFALTASSIQSHACCFVSEPLRWQDFLSFGRQGLKQHKLPNLPTVHTTDLSLHSCAKIILTTYKSHRIWKELN